MIMKIKSVLIKIIKICGVITITLAIDIVANSAYLTRSLINDAQARPGRYVQPNRVAVVSRRTTRRRVHRTSRYVRVLPRGCAVVVVDDVSLHRCGRVYYQPYRGSFVVVVIK